MEPQGDLLVGKGSGSHEKKLAFNRERGRKRARESILCINVSLKQIIGQST